MLYLLKKYLDYEGLKYYNTKLLEKLNLNVSEIEENIANTKDELNNKIEENVSEIEENINLILNNIINGSYFIY